MFASTLAITLFHWASQGSVIHMPAGTAIRAPADIYFAAIRCLALLARLPHWGRRWGKGGEMMSNLAGVEIQPKVLWPHPLRLGEGYAQGSRGLFFSPKFAQKFHMQ